MHAKHGAHRHLSQRAGAPSAVKTGRRAVKSSSTQKRTGPLLFTCRTPRATLNHQIDIILVHRRGALADGHARARQRISTRAFTPYVRCRVLVYTVTVIGTITYIVVVCVGGKRRVPGFFFFLSLRSFTAGCPPHDRRIVRTRGRRRRGEANNMYARETRRVRWELATLQARARCLYTCVRTTDAACILPER